MSQVSVVSQVSSLPSASIRGKRTASCYNQESGTPARVAAPTRVVTRRTTAAATAATNKKKSSKRSATCADGCQNYATGEVKCAIKIYCNALREHHE